MIYGWLIPRLRCLVQQIRIAPRQSNRLLAKRLPAITQSLNQLIFAGVINFTNPASILPRRIPVRSALKMDATRPVAYDLPDSCNEMSPLLL